jgi:hypothetical protein
MVVPYHVLLAHAIAGNLQRDNKYPQNLPISVVVVVAAHELLVTTRFRKIFHEK